MFLLFGELCCRELESDTFSGYLSYTLKLMPVKKFISKNNYSPCNLQLGATEKNTNHCVVTIQN